MAEPICDLDWWDVCVFTKINFQFISTSSIYLYECLYIEFLLFLLVFFCFQCSPHLFGSFKFHPDSSALLSHWFSSTFYSTSTPSVLFATVFLSETYLIFPLFIKSAVSSLYNFSKSAPLFLPLSWPFPWPHTCNCCCITVRMVVHHVNKKSRPGFSFTVSTHWLSLAVV